MNVFKLSAIWQEDVAKNFSKLFSSNKSVEEDKSTSNISEKESLKDGQTAINPRDGHTDEQLFPASPNKLFTDLAKVFHGSTDQEKSPAQERPMASEPISVFPLNNANQSEDAIRPKWGSFFRQSPKSRPGEPLTQCQKGSVNSHNLNAENQYRAHIPNQNDGAEKDPLHKHIVPVLDSDARENGKETLAKCNPVTEYSSAQTELVERNKSEIAHPKAMGINSSTSGQYKGIGRSEERLNDSVSLTDYVALQKLRKFSGGIPSGKDVGAVCSDKDATYRKTLMLLQAVAGERKEMNSQDLEDKANGSAGSEHEQDMLVPPTITYSTYRGAKRFRKRRSQRKSFQPLSPIISEVDEKSVISSVDQSLINQTKEETNPCVLLQDATMTEVQTPSEEKMPLIDHGKANAELQPRTDTAKFPSNKPGLAQDAKTENEQYIQHSFFSGVSREIELTEPHHQEVTKVGRESSPVTTSTIDSTKEQVLQSDTSVSNTTSIQKITAVNPDDISVQDKTMTPEVLHSKGDGVLERDTQCFIQKDKLLADHNDQNHKNGDYADITTSQMTTQTDTSSKTTILMNHVPSASKTIHIKGNETDEPKAHCSTVDAVEAATAQNLKRDSSNNFTPSTEAGQHADNTDRKRQSIFANSEDGALAVSVVIASKQDDVAVETEETEPGSKSEKQEVTLEILDNANAPTKDGSFTMNAIHLNDKLDAPKIILNDNCDAQSEIANRPQTNGHTTVLGTSAVFSNEVGIPDFSTNGMPKEHKDKDSVTGLSTESLTAEYAIEEPLEEYSQTTQWKSESDIIYGNEKLSSEVLKKQTSKDPSMVTTVETRSEGTAASTHVTNTSTVEIDNDKYLRISNAIVSKIATDTAPSALPSYEFSNSESIIITESQEIADASYLKTEGSLYTQKPDQLFKISSEKEHDCTSESLPGTPSFSLESQVSRVVKPSLANESIFYRYYQESTYLSSDSDKNANSIADSEIVAVPAVKQIQLFEEMQDNKTVSNFAAMLKDANEASMGTSKSSPSENILWYRCFQQSTSLLNMWESRQPNIISESNFGSTQPDETAELTKPIAPVADCANEAIPSTLQEDSLNNSRMTHSNEQTEEMAKTIRNYDKKDAKASNSCKLEDEETALKIKERKEELTTLQSRAQLITETCTVDASEAHPVERAIATDSDNILEGKTKEVAEKIISSAMQVTPHIQMSATLIEDDATNTQIELEVMETARLVDIKDDDLNESINNVAMIYIIQEEPKELVTTAEVNDERFEGMVHAKIPGESKNNFRDVSGGQSQDKPLVINKNTSECVPPIPRADKKDKSITMELHEKSISVAPLLPTDTDITLLHAVKDGRNQKAGLGFLNLTSTSQASGSTESASQSIDVKVNDVEIEAQDLVKETEQRTEPSNPVIAAEDSLSKPPSDIMKTDNNSDHTVQEFPTIVSEQCNNLDPTHNTAELKTESVKSSQSNDTQDDAMSNFVKSPPNSEANNFQSGSAESKISQSSLSTDQEDSTNLTIKAGEDGTCLFPETSKSSNILLSNSVKPVNEVAKRMIQKIMLSTQEGITKTQVPDAALVSLSDTGAAIESNMTLPSALTSAVGLVAFKEPVRPLTQMSNTVNKEDVTAPETVSEIIKMARLTERMGAVDLNENTHNLPIGNTIDKVPEEPVKTVEVNDERMVHSEKLGKSEINSRHVSGGVSQDKSLVANQNISECAPPMHRADKKDKSIMMRLHEKSISVAPLLPTDTDLTLQHAVKDGRNQEARFLNLTSTSQASGSTESASQTIDVKVNDVEIEAQDPVKEIEQRTELNNLVIAAEDSLSKPPSDVMKTDNNSDHTVQEFPTIVSEQCNILDPTQSEAELKTDSVKSNQSNDTQDDAMSNFVKSPPNSEANNIQSGSVESKISQSSLSTDQEDSTNLTTKAGEDGTCLFPETSKSSNILLSDSVKPVNEVTKRMIQKIMLSTQEGITNTQVPDAAQVSLSDTGAATESNMILPSALTSAVGLVASKEPVRPLTQTSNLINKEIITSPETVSDIIKTARLTERMKAVDLNESTRNLPIDKTIDKVPEEPVKTVEVNGERVVHSEKLGKYEINSKHIYGGVSQAKPLLVNQNISECAPPMHRADKKDESITMELHEKSIGVASLLPMDTDLTLQHAVKDGRNQEARFLKLTSTSQASGSTESASQTIEVKVNDELEAQDPVKEIVQRTELNNPVIAAEDSLSKPSSDIMKTNSNSGHIVQEFPTIVSEQCNVLDPTQSTAELKTDSVKSSQSNDIQGNLIAVYGESESSKLADVDGFINVSMKNVEEVETGRIAEALESFDIFAHLANLLKDHITESTGITDHIEKEMESHLLEQEALILDTPLSHNISRRNVYPFALSPIYEEQEFENDVQEDVNNLLHSPTSATENISNQLVTSVFEPITASLQFKEMVNTVQKVEEEEEQPTGLALALEANISLSSDHLKKATLISPEINEEQDLSSQLQAETSLADSKVSPEPMSSAAENSAFYKYFRSSKDYLSKDKIALPENVSKALTDLQQKPVEDSNLLKYASDSKYLVKNKNLKINPRPGKMVIYDQLNFRGSKREIFTDVPDAANWTFSEGISFKIVRGCWILYEKPEFQGHMCLLEEGHKEFYGFWVDKNMRMESTPTKIVIGSIKRIVKNHCIPEIAIFQEPQQDNIKAYLHSEVTCLEECGITHSGSSIIVNSGIWLAYYEENFSGRCIVLETGNSPVPLTSEIKSNIIKSLRPLEMGGLKVERPMAPQIVIFEKIFFNGRFKEICEDTSDLKNVWEDGSRGVGSIRVIGGVWVCYEKECYRGHQYLLEEGEYEDWQAWGGFDSTVQSMRYIQADYMKPGITLFMEADLKKGNDVFVTHAIPNLESMGSGSVTRSIEVKSGVWVAYHEEHYSGEQYILEKGVYKNSTGWGGSDCTIMSIRPIQLEPAGRDEVQFQLQAYKGIDFQGQSAVFITETPSLPSLQPNSFKVSHGCWVLYDEKDYNGCQYVLEEGQYPNLDSLGCLSVKPIQSLKPIRNDFSMPSISLFSLYSFEGQELILTEGTSCWKDKDYYQTPKSIKMNSGIWIAYEYANFRGKQLLLEHSEITNWNEFSGWKTIGSLHPLKQPGVYFRIKNKATGGFVTVVGDSKDPRESKLSVCPYNGKPTQIWFYYDGLIKSKANSACIDAIGGQKAGAKVNLWTEHGRTHQKWNINRDGTISSLLDSDLRLDIKGGDFYDKDHIILNFPEKQQTQFWDIDVLN